jgi:very-short-patch-repair endonuclease
MDTKEELKIVEAYRAGQSSVSLAKDYNTYQNKIIRILKKYGEPIRTPSEAQELALKAGRSEHPTKGKRAGESTKLKQSETQAKRWRSMNPEKKENLRAGARERWEDRSEESKKAMLTKAGQALQKASKEGSKAEKYINTMLQKHGYSVIMHKTGLIAGDYELDLYLPDLGIVIELDGPQHFLPIFGEELLQKNIKYDATKNGALISKGFSVIRVKYIVKHLSEKIKRDLWAQIYDIVQKMEQGVINNQLIEVELNG